MSDTTDLIQRLRDIGEKTFDDWDSAHEAADALEQQAKEIAALRSLLFDVHSALDYHQEQTRPIHSTRTALAAIDAALRQEAK